MRMQNPQAAWEAIPERRRPKVPIGHDDVWEAWSELSTCRPLTMGGEGPIPWTAIAQWSRDRGMSAYDADELRQLIRVMDSEYLTERAKQAEARAKGAKRAN